MHTGVYVLCINGMNTQWQIPTVWQHPNNAAVLKHVGFDQVTTSAIFCLCRTSMIPACKTVGSYRYKDCYQPSWGMCNVYRQRRLVLHLPVRQILYLVVQLHKSKARTETGTAPVGFGIQNKQWNLECLQSTKLPLGWLTLPNLCLEFNFICPELSFTSLQHDNYCCASAASVIHPYMKYHWYSEQIILLFREASTYCGTVDLKS